LCWPWLQTGCAVDGSSEPSLPTHTKTMSNLEKRERTAIEAVARRLSATWEESNHPSGAYIAIAGKRVALKIASMKKPGRDDDSRAKLRLRLDKVAVRVVEHLRSTLHEAVPESVTVLVTITAPIRLASKTAAALEDKIRALLARRTERIDEKATIHGNHIRIRLEKSASRAAAKVIGFVHNPDTDPQVLMNMTRALLELLRARADTDARKKFVGDRWLVVMNEGTSAHIDAYRYIYFQLRILTDFAKILMVFGDGRVEALN